MAPRGPITFGAGFARAPYNTTSFFNISAMSFGALSAPAISALYRGAKRAGIRLNTGEGAISPLHLEGGCDIVFQISTAKYGVRDEQGTLSDDKLKAIASHPEVRMFEIKLSQGANPGKGGILTGIKVTKVIASSRDIPEGQDSLSPNRHPDISCIDDMLDMIHRGREVTGKPVSIKAVIGKADWLDELCLHIQQRGLHYAPDFLPWTAPAAAPGRPPQSLIDYTGLPVQRSLPLVVDKLLEYGLRERIRVICSGKMVNPGGGRRLPLPGPTASTPQGLHVRPGLRAVFAVQQDHLSHRQYQPRSRPTGGSEPRRQGPAGAHYATNFMHEVEVIAHSCGVAEPRLLNRGHAQEINGYGVPEPMWHFYPKVEARP